MIFEMGGASLRRSPSDEGQVRRTIDALNNPLSPLSDPVNGAPKRPTPKANS
jgi:hypothetical protein